MANQPKIGRLAAWVDCVCGSEVEFEDLDEDLGAMVSIPCDDCGRIIEISVDLTVQERRVT